MSGRQKGIEQCVSTLDFVTAEWVLCLPLLDTNSGACSLASVKGKTQKKRKRDDDSDEAEAFSDSGSDIGEAQHTRVFWSCNT